MKKSILLLIIITFFCVSVAYATDNSGKLPSNWTYAKEWINVNIFSLRNESKVKTLNRYANERANNIQTAATINQTDKIDDLVNRYENLATKANEILQKNNIKSKTDIIASLQDDIINQQRIISGVRQNVDNEIIKNELATAQQVVVNQTKKIIKDTIDTQSADEFGNQIVSVWRDPKSSVTDENATRVYAAGTTANGNVNDGVIIDGGQAKISQNNNGDLLIEYAPGTGPSSVTTSGGQKVWTIQMSDGSTVESYTSASSVVVGGSSGVSSNVIVNTTNGTTSSTAQTVVGGGSGQATVEVVGGKQVIQTQATQMEQQSTVSDPNQTTTNTINSANSLNTINQ